jgi:nucleoside 2-deoxyribosyltransferase
LVGPWFTDRGLCGPTGSFIETGGIPDCGGPVHGQAWRKAHNAIESADVLYLCEAAIVDCDLMFVWIDKEDCFGTIWEMGYATGRSKPVFVYVRGSGKRSDADHRELGDDQWLAITASKNSKTKGYRTARAAWQQFLTVDWSAAIGFEAA